MVGYSLSNINYIFFFLETQIDFPLRMKQFFAFILIIAMLSRGAESGPLAYGICQTGCNAGVVACYTAAGVTFGTVTAGAG